ncbi:MAG: hypothetical protein HY739_03915 [Desulfobacterales bacterium]|nr:hypothetical protein [Desulfobacterales bacterium]
MLGFIADLIYDGSFYPQKEFVNSTEDDMKVIMSGNELKVVDRIDNLRFPIPLGDYISTVLIIEMGAEEFGELLMAVEISQFVIYLPFDSVHIGRLYVFLSLFYLP